MRINSIADIPAFHQELLKQIAERIESARTASMSVEEAIKQKEALLERHKEHVVSLIESRAKAIAEFDQEIGRWQTLISELEKHIAGLKTAPLDREAPTDTITGPDSLTRPGDSNAPPGTGTRPPAKPKPPTKAKRAKASATKQRKKKTGGKT